MVETKVPKVVKQLAELTKKLPGLEKNKKAPEKAGGYAYRGIDDLLDTLHPLLIECKLNITPRVLPELCKVHYHEEAGMKWLGEVYVEYEFQSTEDGSTKVIGPVLGTGADNLDKTAGKAMTSAFKNAMYQTFCIPVGDSSIDPETGVDEPQQQARTSTTRASSDTDKDDKHRHELHEIAVKLSKGDIDVYAGYIKDWTSYQGKDRDGKPVERYCTKASDKYPNSDDFILQGKRLNIAITNARKSLAAYELNEAGPAELTPDEQAQIDSMLGAAPPE